jgi:hypothetical protein
MIRKPPSVALEDIVSSTLLVLGHVLYLGGFYL